MKAVRLQCPWCWKRMLSVHRIDRDPTAPVVSADGAPFLCAHCKQISIVVGVYGHALRKPTATEQVEMATTQQLADQLPEGELTQAEVAEIAAVYQQSGKVH